MSKNQWIGLLSVLMVISLLSTGILYYVNSNDSERKTVETTNKKKSEKELNNSSSRFYDITGFDSKVLTKDEITELITKWKKDGESVDEDYVVNRLEEEYGEINSLAYSYGLMVDDEDSDFLKLQVINGLADVFGYENTHIYPTISLVDVMNPIGEEFGNKPKEEPNVVSPILFNTRAIYRADTNGFKDVGEVKVGYPQIGGKPYYLEVEQAEDLIENNFDDYFMTEVLIYVLVEDTMKLKELYNKLEDMEVEVNGKELNLLGTWLMEQDKYLAKEEGFLPLGIQGDYEDLDDKYVLKDTVFMIGYEMNLGDLADGRNKYIRDFIFYADEEHGNTPTVTINGVEFSTENSMLEPEGEEKEILFRR